MQICLSVLILLTFIPGKGHDNVLECPFKFGPVCDLLYPLDHVRGRGLPVCAPVEVRDDHEVASLGKQVRCLPCAPGVKSENVIIPYKTFRACPNKIQFEIINFFHLSLQSRYLNGIISFLKKYTLHLYPSVPS